MDRLDAAMRKIGDEIRQTERRLAELRGRMVLLDQARLLVTNELQAAEEGAIRSAALQTLEEMPTRGLQEEVLQCVDALGEVTDDGFASARHIAAMLRARRYPGAEARGFYSSCYTTLMRLVAKGMISVRNDTDGRRFGPRDRTQALFTLLRNGASG